MKSKNQDIVISEKGVNKKSRDLLYQWSLWIVGLLFFIALFQPFLSNDRPIFAKIKGKWSSPVMNEVLHDLGIVEEDRFGKFFLEYESSIWPPIRFKDNNINTKDGSYLPPYSTSSKGRHFLGTDLLGRDVAAGMINGCNIAAKVGFFSILLALILGLLLGVPAGYLGNEDWLANIPQIVVLILFTLITGYFIVLEYGYFNTSIWKGSLIVLASLGLGFMLYLLFQKIKWRQYKIPLDLIIMKVIEVRKSIPGMFIVLAAVAVFTKSSIWNIVIIAGVLYGVDLARYVRAEVINLRVESFIKSAKGVGSSPWQIIINHIIPNAIPPLYTVLAFSVSGAILMEASLSFLGIGIPLDEVTWGSMLSEARKFPKAWWLAFFPGLAIFFVVASLNIIGDKLARLK